MITFLILSIISPIFGLLIGLLPVADQTINQGIASVINMYVIPMFTFMKVWLPMDVIYDWSVLVLTLHVAVIIFKFTGKIVYTLSGGLIKTNSL